MGLQNHQAKILGAGACRLVLMRHFSAQTSQFGIHDRDRSLVLDKSQEELDIIKKNCSQDFHHISLVICSNTKRTRQTLDEILPLLASHTEIQVVDSLYCADMDQILDHLRSIDLDHQTVLIIAHNPGLGCFLQKVQKENSGCAIPHSKSFPVGGVAIFDRVCESWIKISYKSLKLRNMVYLDLKKI